MKSEEEKKGKHWNSGQDQHMYNHSPPFKQLQQSQNVLLKQFKIRTSFSVNFPSDAVDSLLIFNLAVTYVE